MIATRYLREFVTFVYDRFRGCASRTLEMITMKQPRPVMEHPHWKNRFLPLPAALPRWSCPCPSFPPPKRSRRGDWRSPTLKKAPVPRRRTRGCGTCQRGKRAGRCSAKAPAGCRWAAKALFSRSAIIQDHRATAGCGQWSRTGRVHLQSLKGV